MIPNLPAHISLIFVLTVLLTFILFWRSNRWPRWLLWVLLGWLSLHGLLGYLEFYPQFEKLPPRFLILVIPALLFVMASVFYKPLNQRNKEISLRALVLVHVVRIPVEFVLLWLGQNGKIPMELTFEGRNFDILAGITAPMVFLWGFENGKAKKTLNLIWNVIFLGFLLNIVSQAILSAPFPFQQFGFDQPNIAVFYFPFIWLPGFIVPIVLFAHLVSIKRLLKE